MGRGSEGDMALSCRVQEGPGFSLGGVRGPWPWLSALRAVLRAREVEGGSWFFFLPGPNLPLVKRQELPKSVRIWNSPV